MDDEVKMVIVIRKDLKMRRGKEAAQAAHAAMKFLVENNEAKRDDELLVKLSQLEAEWLFNSMAKIVVSCDNEEELEKLMVMAHMRGVQVHKIIDAGRTEFKGVPTVTCAAFGPEKSSELDPITGSLKLL